MPLSGDTLDTPIELCRLLRPGLDSKPDEVALVSTVNRWTWRQVDTASDNLAGNLLGLGLRPGDRVASLMPNRAVLLIHYIACLRAGLVAVPLNYRYMPPEIDHALEVSEAAILLAHAERGQDLAASKLVGRLPRGTISYEASDGASPSFAELVERAPSTMVVSALDPADPAFIFFTSGSTGRPKGVTHSRAAVGWMLASTAAAFELTPRDVLLPGSSISHIGGFIFSFAALAVGARVVVARTFDSHELLALLRDQRPTVLCMLPAALFRLERDHDAVRDDFASAAREATRSRPSSSASSPD